MLNTLLLASSHGNSDADVMVFIVPIVAIVCTFAWLIVKTLVSPFSSKAEPPGPNAKPFRRWRNGPGSGLFPEASAPTGGLTEEEQAVLLKLQQTLAKMERRIESLETILIDQARTNEKYGTKH